MATAPETGSHAAPAMQDDYGVLVGWSHAPISRGIQLKVQSATADGQRTGTITARSYLMTRNQAMILAKYLLDATGQTLPPPPRAGRMARFWRRITGG